MSRPLPNAPRSKLAPLVREIGWAKNLCRRAADDGSRGFQPTDERVPWSIRRGATGECGGGRGVFFKRRDATQDGGRAVNRGSKPTATVMGSLRDREAATLAKKIQKNFEGLGV